MFVYNFQFIVMVVVTITSAVGGVLTLQISRVEVSVYPCKI